MKCEAQGPLCSNQLVVRYDIDGDDIPICGACAAYIGRAGVKLVQSKRPPAAK